MKPGLYDVVQLAESISSENLAKGDQGTIVLAHSKPHEAYEVEFCDKDGATLALVALKPGQFSVVWKRAHGAEKVA
jgi:uncharacterized protein YpmB